MDPGQRDVRRHWAERDRLVPDIGEVLVGRPVVCDQPGVRRDGIEYESMKVLLAKPSITWSRAR